MKNYSIIKFGSQLNSNFDKYSDKDLLIVTETNEQLIKLYEKYSKEGWSVSSYTFSKLKYLSNKGSLFISHLKQDSKIIFDFEHKFEKILNAHSDKENYKYEIKDSKNYFNILKETPDLPLGYAWFADCFYVGLRNYLIFYYAQKGILEFSYLKIIETLLKDELINETEYTILKELRVVKHNYREDILDILPQKSFINSLITIARKLHLLNGTFFINPNRFEGVILNSISNETYNGYQRLRLIEGIYCSKEVNIPEIKRIISNPQFYASKLVDNEFMMKMIEIFNKNATQQSAYCIAELVFHSTVDSCFAVQS